MKTRRGLRAVSAALFAAMLAAPLALSCSREEPRILYGFIELVYRPEERFTFFVIAEDDDGIDNLSELYLYHDRQGLRWTLNADDWIRFDQDGQTWIGARGLAMSDGEPFPRGQYRAVLVNKGGERGERAFTFDGPVEPRFPFPVFTIEDGQYALTSGYPVNRLLCYDQSGGFVQIAPIPAASGPVSALGLPGGVRTVALWAEDAERRTSAVTGAVSVR